MVEGTGVIEWGVLELLCGGKYLQGFCGGKYRSYVVGSTGVIIWREYRSDLVGTIGVMLGEREAGVMRVETQEDSSD